MVTGATALLDKVDVLIISPFKPDALGPIVSAAKAKGIPVIVDDIGGGGTPYDAIVISDNVGGGKLAAEFMDAQIKMHAGASKKVVSIGCPPDAVYAARRNEGFEARIKELGLHGRDRPVRQLRRRAGLHGHEGRPRQGPGHRGRLLLQRPDGRRRVERDQGRRQGSGQGHRDGRLQRRSRGHHPHPERRPLGDRRPGPLRHGRPDGRPGQEDPRRRDAEVRQR